MSLSDIIINLLLRMSYYILICSPTQRVRLAFLIRWSDDVSTSIFLLFSQTIPILFATLSSINSDSLSLFDAHFAVAVSASPMSTYVSICCFLQLFRVETRLFKKVSSHEARVLILLLGLLFPLLWFSVSITTSFSTTAFTNSYYCKGMTVPRYLEFLVVSTFFGVLDIMGHRDIIDDVVRRGCLGILSVVGLFLGGALMVRHQEEIIQKSKENYLMLSDNKRQPVVKRYVWGRPFLYPFKKYFLFAWYVSKACW